MWKDNGCYCDCSQYPLSICDSLLLHIHCWRYQICSNKGGEWVSSSRFTNSFIYGWDSSIQYKTTRRFPPICWTWDISADWSNNRESFFYNQFCIIRWSLMSIGITVSMSSNTFEIADKWRIGVDSEESTGKWWVAEKQYRLDGWVNWQTDGY